MSSKTSLIQSAEKLGSKLTDLSFRYDLLQQKYNELEQRTGGGVLVSSYDNQAMVDLQERLNIIEMDNVVKDQEIENLELTNANWKRELENAIDARDELRMEFDILMTFFRNVLQVKATNVDDIVGEAEIIVGDMRNRIADDSIELLRLRTNLTNLERTTAANEQQLLQTIDDINNSLSSELDNIDTELVLYGRDDGDDNKIDNIDDYLNVTDYDTSTTSVRREYFPFIRYIAAALIEQPEDNMPLLENDTMVYHAYMMTVQKLFAIYPKAYIRRLVATLYETARNSNGLVRLPNLILPQTTQINSLYYLMNRYNTKAYEPDRVFDFGDFLFNFIKPEFRPDTTLALNLFQPGIGKRYNSIFIYSEETMKKLSQLRDNLSQILESSSTPPPPPST